jgi:hypothetical protein
MKSTSGRRGSSSSKSAALQSSLENKLRARLEGCGSMLFWLTWREQVTPSGRPICALVASARRTSGNDYTSWPTPRSADDRKGQDLTANVKERGTDLPTVAGWATPAAAEAGGTPEQFLARKKKAVLNGKQLGVSLTSLSLQALTVSGVTPNGSLARTVDRGRLNPAHSRWLMGFPHAWDDCADTGTQSSRHSLSRSSEPHATLSNPWRDDL